MSQSTKNNLFLEEVYLSGFKTIQDVKVEFQRGLNIIIGKNASGKTNFLTFLNSVLLLDYQELNNFESELIFQNEEKISLKTKSKFEIDKPFNATSLKQKIEFDLIIAGKNLGGNDLTTIQLELDEKNVAFSSTFLGHGIPSEYFVVDKPLSFGISSKNASSELLNLIANRYTPYFIKNLSLDFLEEFVKTKYTDKEKIRLGLNNKFNELIELNIALSMYTPIQEVKFSENFNVYYEEVKEIITVSNIFLEFKIGGTWLPFANLSDGTKRLFYIISEVLDNSLRENEILANNDFLYLKEDISRIILIEEPELGIHPHQFHKLMEFLKIESEKKQIIITTHSPQALDSIDKNELNRILIASISNQSEGTKLRHLNDDEIKKANLYMKEDFLSDYWLYSDLEK